MCVYGNTSSVHTVIIFLKVLYPGSNDTIDNMSAHEILKLNLLTCFAKDMPFLTCTY